MQLQMVSKKWGPVKHPITLVTFILAVKSDILGQSVVLMATVTYQCPLGCEGLSTDLTPVFLMMLQKIHSIREILYIGYLSLKCLTEKGMMIMMMLIITITINIRMTNYIYIKWLLFLCRFHNTGKTDMIFQFANAGTRICDDCHNNDHKDYFFSNH